MTRKAAALALLLIAFSGQAAFALPMIPADAPQPGLLGNSIIDIIFENGIVWMATGDGLAISLDTGKTFQTFTTESGLVTNEPSAVIVLPNRVWVANSHSQFIDGFNIPFGDGFNSTADTGLTWDTIAPLEASKVGRLAYDFAYTGNGLYAATWYGGLIASFDGGQNWEHLYLSNLDSLDWVADSTADLQSGLYFSCVGDTLHADTLVVWAGTAAGIQKFLYLPKRVKLGGKKIYDIVGRSDTIFLAHEGGITRTDSSLATYTTVDMGSGLPSNEIRRLLWSNETVLAGAFDPGNDYGLGIYYSNTAGDSWQPVGNASFDGENSGVRDFRQRGGLVYAAAGDSGTFYSDDDGLTWQRIYPEPAITDLTNPVNQVYSVDATLDSIFFGTKAGLVRASYSYTPPFSITGSTLETFPDNDSSGSFVSLVRVNEGPPHYTWVGLKPQTAGGNEAAWFINSIGERSLIIASNPGEDQIAINDIIATDTVSAIATGVGLVAHDNSGDRQNTFFYSLVDTASGFTLNSFEMLSVNVIDGRMFAGAQGGVGYRRTNIDWRVRLPNLSPNKHDLAVVYNVGNQKITGNFVVAMEQHVTPEIGGVRDTVIWAATRVTGSSQQNGVSYTKDFGQNWEFGLDGELVWNFAFDDISGDVYAAASSGLYRFEHDTGEWFKEDIVDMMTQDTIVSTTEVFAVAVAGDKLLVGTGLGLATRDREPGSPWAITRVFKETESASDVFASPVPFSPLDNNGRMSFHYHVEQDAYISVEVYDFAMNLVKTVTESRFRSGGADYFETWDGYNESGDMVALGMYFFKVSYSTGEVHWGRLAIVP
jgi:hypothetical protein